jgi:protein SCO1/2
MKNRFPIFLLILACSATVFGQGKDQAKAYFTDTVVVDQDGKTHRLYSDLMEGKTVVVMAFHADCTSVGPPMLATIRRLQDELGPRAGEFNILAVSVDTGPDGDTPAKSKALKEKHKLGPNIYFLTGEKANVDLVAKKFGYYVANKDDHTTVLTMGNTKTGLWKKVYGLAKADDIKASLLSVLDDGKK